MRRIISLVLFAVFLFNLEGYYFIFRIKQLTIQKNIQAEIRSKLTNDKLILFIVPTHKVPLIHWIRKDIEFIQNGKLFDVVRSKTIEGLKYYYCIDDIKEKRLIADYQKKCDQNNKSKKPIRTVSNTVYLLSSFSIIIPQPCYIRGFCNPVFDFNSRITDIISPPPKQVILS